MFSIKRFELESEGMVSQHYVLYQTDKKFPSMTKNGGGETNDLLEGLAQVASE